MQRNYEIIKKRASELLENGTVNRVMGWQEGEFFYDATPTVFTDKGDLDKLVYNCFCAANQSKYLVNESKKEGKILAVLKPCDTLSFNQLVQETRVDRDNVYVLGVECSGMVDINKIKDLGIKGIKGVKEDGEELVIDTLYGEKRCKKADVLLEKCVSCKSKKHFAYDELTYEGDPEEIGENGRFDLVEKLENMSAQERFDFWRSELSKCIRCNACRNVCPACTCRTCIFDRQDSGAFSKAPVDSFEENMFHIIRAFHVAGRCTDCGECTRVCPQNIPIHLLNRKFIKDINEFYGEYQAGEDTETLSPLTSYTKTDCEPSIVRERGNE